MKAGRLFGGYNLVRGHKDLDWAGGSGRAKKLDLGYVLKVEPTGFIKDWI